MAALAPTLRVLSVYGNRLTGPVPAELGNLTVARLLNLAKNRFSGRIPPALGRARQLAELVLARNALTGSVPAELGNLTRLTALNVQHNQLSGAIPGALGRLVDLQQLRVNNNMLSGQIPEALGGASKLRELHMHHNRLTGCIPPFLSKVAYFSVRDNPDLDAGRVCSSTSSGTAALALVLVCVAALAGLRWRALRRERAADRRVGYSDNEVRDVQGDVHTFLKSSNGGAMAKAGVEVAKLRGTMVKAAANRQSFKNSRNSKKSTALRTQKVSPEGK